MPHSPATAEALPQNAVSCLSRYLIFDALGQGGMGTVFQGYDPELGRRLAIKVVDLPHEEAANAAQANASTATRDLVTNVQSNAVQRDALVAEARALARVSHPNIVPIFDVGIDKGKLFVAMELVQGHTLRSWLKAKKRPTWRAIAKVMLSLARGLSHVHSLGLVHRDVKPDNVLVRPDGSIVLIDFGLAVRTTAAQIDAHAGGEKNDDLFSGKIAGTPAYMAPEQHRGQEVGPAADVFAYCVCFIEALTGVRPALDLAAKPDLGATERTVVQSARYTAPSWLLRILTHGLAFSPADRPSSLDDLMAQIEVNLAAQQRSRRFGLGLIAATASVVALLSTVERTTTPVQPVQTLLESVESPDILAQARDGVLATALPDALDLWDDLERALGERLEQARDSLHELENSDASVARPQLWACLEGHIAQLDTLLRVLAQADPQIARQALGAVQNLSPASSCLSSKAQTTVPVPSDPALLAAVAQARIERQRIRLMIHTGSFALAQQRAELLRDHARDLGFAPLVAEVEAELGLLGLHQARAVEAREHFVQGQLHAIAGRHAQIAASSGAFILHLDSFFLSQVGDPSDRLKESLAWIERAGRPAPALAEWHRDRALFALAGPQPGNCLSETIQAKEWEWQATEVDLVLRTVRLSDRAFCALTEGDEIVADHLLREALRFGERALGPHHPGLFAALHNLATVATHRERYAEARRYQDHSIRALSSQREHDDRLLWQCQIELIIRHAHYRFDRLGANNPVCAAAFAQMGLREHVMVHDIRARDALVRAKSDDQATSRAALAHTMNNLSVFSAKHKMHTELTPTDLIVWLDVALALEDRDNASRLLALLDREGLSTSRLDLRAELFLIKGEPVAALQTIAAQFSALYRDEVVGYGPFAQYRLLFLQGRARAALNQPSLARQSFHQALTVAEHEFGPDNPRSSEVWLELALLPDASPHERANDLSRAMQHARRGSVYLHRWKRQGPLLLRELDRAKVELDPAVRQWLTSGPGTLELH